MLKELLPKLKQRWQNRLSRPLPDSVCFALAKFSQIWIVDASTLEALFKKLDSRKLIFYSIKHYKRIPTDIVTACFWELYKYKLLSPFYHLTVRSV